MSKEVNAKHPRAPPPLAAILDWDERITRNVLNVFEKRVGLRTYRSTLKQLEISCHGVPWFVLTFAGLYLIPSWVALWVNLLYLLTLDVIVVAVVKAFVRRRRPKYNSDDMFMTVSVDKFSFPSGHATRAIVLSLAIFELIANHITFLLGLPVLIWGLAVCASRVLLGRHFVLDVVGGILLGLIQIIVLNYTWIDEGTASNAASLIFGGEDPWSSG